MAVIPQAERAVPVHDAEETLLSNPKFAQAIADARRMNLVADFEELGPDTLRVGLSDPAMSAASTEYNMGRIYAAYSALTEWNP